MQERTDNSKEKKDKQLFAYENVFNLVKSQRKIKQYGGTNVHLLNAQNCLKGLYLV